MFWLYYVHLSSHPTAVCFSPPKKRNYNKKNLIYDNQLDYMQISDSFSSSLKSFCCLLCELLSKYLNESGLIAENRMMWSCECVHIDSELSRWVKEKNKLEESEWDSFFLSFRGDEVVFQQEWRRWWKRRKKEVQLRVNRNFLLLTRWWDEKLNNNISNMANWAKN